GIFDDLVFIENRLQERYGSARHRGMSRAVRGMHGRSLWKRHWQQMAAKFAEDRGENVRSMQEIGVNRIRPVANPVMNLDASSELFRTQAPVNQPFLIPDGFQCARSGF